MIRPAEKSPDGARVDRKTLLAEYRRLLLNPQTVGRITDDLRAIAEGLGYGAQVAEGDEPAAGDT